MAWNNRIALVMTLAWGLFANGCSEDSGSCEGDDCEMSSKECSTGEEGCECYGNGTCDDGLTCYSDLCVDPADDDNTSADDDDDANSSSNDDDDDDDDDTGASSPADDDDEGSSNDDEPSGGASSGGGTSDDNDDNDDDSSVGGGTDDDDSSSGSSGGGSGTSGTPVATHGQLSVVGTNIVNQSGEVVQLKGVSSMWLNWEDNGYAEDLEGLEYMRDEWGLNLIRAAMGIEPAGAYLENPDKARRQVETIIDNAIEAGVYVIIDWHDHEATAHQSEAQAFFSDMAEKYGETPNVLYEVFNEPLDLSWASQLKPYHEALRDTIRGNDPDNIIILGTPNWDQDVDVAAGSPLSGANLVYALHFYSCSHDSQYRSRAQQALNAGLPLFVSEWGAATADGIDTDASCINEAAAWHDWMDDNGIGWAAWKFDNCTDATCFFVDDNVPTNGNWSDSQLNGLHPQFAIERMRRAQTPGVVVTEDPPGASGSCTPSGSCAAGNAMDCNSDDELIDADCSACDVLGCSDCCSRVGYFGAVSQPTFSIEDELVSAYSVSSSGVSLTMDFDFSSFPSAEEQIGALAFALDGAFPVDPVSLTVCGSFSDSNNVQVTLEDGDSGCLYWMYVSGDCAFPDSLVTCWGDWASAGQDLTSQINVRTAAISSGTETMTVSYVGW